MSDYYTVVDGGGYMCRGQMTRAKALEETRRHAAHMRDKYAAICEHLSQPDDQIAVRIVKGYARERLVRELLP